MLPAGNWPVAFTNFKKKSDTEYECSERQRAEMERTPNFLSIGWFSGFPHSENYYVSLQYIQVSISFANENNLGKPLHETWSLLRLRLSLNRKVYLNHNLSALDRLFPSKMNSFFCWLMRILFLPILKTENVDRAGTEFHRKPANAGDTLPGENYSNRKVLIEARPLLFVLLRPQWKQTAVIRMNSGKRKCKSLSPNSLLIF